MAEFVVITFSSLNYLKDLINIYKNKKVIVTTLTYSKALKKGLNPLIYENVWIRAYSHKPVKIFDLDEADSEAILVAQELSAQLVTSDEKIEKIAKEMGINVVRYP
ncbi:hypothetical protein SJAV_03310 [Sulfurisphaera javensis]|uniref:PIN domain-containing protein n=1 Tax=Sulfurisphaera javensis TaxID=2049879 RepID=A0AAT9GNC6_9CREN